MRNIVSVLLVLSLIGIIRSVEAKSFSQIQDLYKKIGEDLGNLRKEYTVGQPKIYTILDRIDRMYNLTVGIHKKKKNFKKLAKENLGEVSVLREENKILKNELLGIQQRADITSKKLEVVGKQLELEKNQTSKLAQEKGDLTSKIKQFESEKKHMNEKVAKGVEDDVEEQLKHFKNGQSLSLSSTSAPSSPR